MISLLLATNNRGKTHELRALLRGIPAQIVSPEEAGLNLAVAEDGISYQENAIKKAMAFCAASGLLTLADDSGLEVDALDGAPGLHSARYVTRSGATDADRRAALLRSLRDLPLPWTARFCCAIAIAEPGSPVFCAEGTCGGEITPVERGHGGFGYDPIFLVAGTGLTMAELELEDKNLISHRAHAVQNALPHLLRAIGH